MESLQVGGNPVVTTASLPTGDLNLSPSTSIPIEQSDLEEFCAKTGELVGQIQSAEETAIVLEGIAARLDESSNKAEARATRYVVECLCENVGIEKTKLKGNEEGSDPETADKISIVLENISDSLKKIWQAIRDALRRLASWIKEFVGGVKKRLFENKKRFSTLEKAHADYTDKKKKGEPTSFNPTPLVLSPAELQLISGGNEVTTAKYLLGLTTACGDVVSAVEASVQSFSKVAATVEKGSNAGLAFDNFPDIKKFGLSSIEEMKQGFGDIQPSKFCDIHKGLDIGNAFSVIYALPSASAQFQNTEEMAEGVRSAVIKFVPLNNSVKGESLPVLDDLTLATITNSFGAIGVVITLLFEAIEASADIATELAKAADKKASENGEPGDAHLFSALASSITSLIVGPSTQLINYLDKVRVVEEKYLEHALRVG